MGQLFNEMGGVDIMRRFTDRLVADLLFVQADVAGDGAGEDKRILQHSANMLTQFLLAHVTYINAINGDSALLHVIETRHQADNRSFTCASSPYKSNSFSGANLERDTF